MARIRSVKPSLFGSYNLAKLPIEARYLFIGLFCEADDEGYLIDSPKRIAGDIFPHDDKVTEGKVNGWLNQLQEVGSVLRYTTRDGRYIFLPEWEKHQRVTHGRPTTLPLPSCDVLADFLRRSGATPEPLVPEGELNGKRN